MPNETTIQKILQALELRPLSDKELSNHTELPVSDLMEALYHLRTQNMWIEKHQTIDNGCRDCACHVTYKWRLTIGGREQLKSIERKDHE